MLSPDHLKSRGSAPATSKKVYRYICGAFGWKPLCFHKSLFPRKNSAHVCVYSCNHGQVWWLKLSNYLYLCFHYRQLYDYSREILMYFYMHKLFTIHCWTCLRTYHFNFFAFQKQDEKFSPSNTFVLSWFIVLSHKYFTFIVFTIRGNHKNFLIVQWCLPYSSKYLW